MSVLVASSSRSLGVVVALWLFPASLAALAWMLRADGGIVILALIFGVVLFGAGLYELFRPSYTVRIDLNKTSVSVVRESIWKRSDTAYPLGAFDSVASTWDSNYESYCVNLVGKEPGTQLLVKRFPAKSWARGPEDTSAGYRKEIAVFCGFRDLGLLPGS